MTRSARDFHVEALDVLLRRKVAAVMKSRDWELLEEIARIAQADAPVDLAMTDPSRYRALREAITDWHLMGFTNMTPERVRRVAADAGKVRDGEEVDPDAPIEIEDFLAYRGYPDPEAARRKFSLANQVALVVDRLGISDADAAQRTGLPVPVFRRIVEGRVREIGEEEIEAALIALKRWSANNDPLGYSEPNIRDRLRHMAEDALAGVNEDAVEREANIFRERLRAAGLLIELVQYGHPVRLRLSMTDGQPDTIEAARILARRHFSLRDGLPAMTRLRDCGRIEISVPMVEDVAVLLEELRQTGMTVELIEP